MHGLLNRHGEYFSDGVMQGKLFEVDGYPGAVESNDPNDRVYGEVYRIIDREALLAKLDHYEQCTDHFAPPHEYQRRKICVSLSSGGCVCVWAYVFDHDVKGLTQITSGNYIDFIKR